MEDHGLNQPEVRFNPLPLSYQNNGQEEDAKKTYEPLAGIPGNTVPSYAANQQGVLVGNEQKYEGSPFLFQNCLT